MVLVLLNQNLNTLTCAEMFTQALLGKSGQIIKLQYKVGGGLKCKKHAKETIEWNSGFFDKLQ